MKSRFWILLGALALLFLAYAWFFTEWIRPEPIQISSQVRTSILQPRFGRGPVTVKQTNAATGKVESLVLTNAVGAVDKGRRARLPQWGEIGDAPGGVANVTFTLDAPYQLTALRVQDVPADGSAPRVIWDLVGRSVPMSSLLYGRVPQGMRFAKPGETNAAPLNPGAPYILILEAGRRRGTNAFTTRPAAVQ